MASFTLPGLPVIGAPMAGGPSTPELVTAVARAGGVGFLAAGYKDPPTVAAQIQTVQLAGVTFGLNIFVPQTGPLDAEAIARYAERLQPEQDRYEIELPAPDLTPNDDHWHDKLDLVLRDPVPFVSFTFGVPDRDVIAKLQAAGSTVLVTVTSPDEAVAAAAASPDALVVQSAAAGGHSGTRTPQTPNLVTDTPGLVAAVRAVCTLPLADPARQATVVTRAFSGRPARGIRNRFTDTYSGVAPLGYPAINTLTGPIRRAAAARGDADGVNLWAGTGYRSARDVPASEVMTGLAARL